MNQNANRWRHWKRFFEGRRERVLPRLEIWEDYSAFPASLARSLAKFQLRKSRGDTIVGHARNSSLRGIDRHYADAMALLVKEQHYHSELLAICIRNLGGELVRSSRTAKLAANARGLIGLRFKVLVMLATEIVGTAAYQLLSERLPNTRIQSLLASIASDERAHLPFHCDFLRLQMGGAVRRSIFTVAWRVILFVAALVVLVDHRQTLRNLGIASGTAWRRCAAYGEIAERLVVDNEAAVFPEIPQIEGVILGRS